MKLSTQVESKTSFMSEPNHATYIRKALKIVIY